MDEDALRRIGWRGMAAFQRLIGRHTPGPPPLVTDAFVASAVPEIVSAVISAAVPIGGAPLAPHLDQLEAFYARNPKWGVWVDPANAQDAEALRARGLVLDSWPVLMATPLTEAAGPTEEVAAERVTMQEVGAVNDAAYGHAASIIEAGVRDFPAGEMYAYGSRVDGAIASALLIQDVVDDAFVTMVATLPSHRGQKLASNLLAHALQEAQQRGLTTTSLQASKLGQGIYARLGYRPLGEVHLYEKRPA